MSAVIVRNTRAGEQPPVPPSRSDGTLFTHAMFFAGGRKIAFADSPADLIAALVDGYEQMEDEDRLGSRVTLALRAQVSIQGQINAEASADAWSALSDAERDALSGPRVTQPAVKVWEPQIPLVVVDSGYAPYTDLTRPVSAIADVLNPVNLIWLRPADEWDLLVSLDRAGFIALSVSLDA